MRQNIIISKQFKSELATASQNVRRIRSLYSLMRRHVRCVGNLSRTISDLKQAQVITIGTTDSSKTLDTLASVWEALQQGGATRHSLLINLGGGYGDRPWWFCCFNFQAWYQLLLIFRPRCLRW